MDPTHAATADAAVQQAAEIIMQQGTNEAVQATSSSAATAAATTVASAAAAAAATGAVRAAPTCPAMTPFVRSFTCPSGADASLYGSMLQPPAWLLVSQSAQGVLALFSFKHLALTFLPVMSGWGAKLASLRNGGRIISPTAAVDPSQEQEGLAAAFMDDADASSPSRQTAALPQLLAEFHSRDSALQDESIAFSLSSDSTSSSTVASSSSSIALDIPRASSSSSTSSSSAIAAAPPTSTTSVASSSSSSSSSVSPRIALLQQLYLNSATDQIASLGRDSHEQILSFLSATEVALCMSVSRTWYRSANADHLWIAMNKNQLVQQFMSKENGLSQLIIGLSAQQDEIEKSPTNDDASLHEDTVHPSLPNDSESPGTKRTHRQQRQFRKHFDDTLRKLYQTLKHYLISIAFTWHRQLIEIEAGSATTALSSLARSALRAELEQAYLEDTHGLTAAIQKINQFIAYMKKAEKHARAVIELNNGSSSSSSSAPTSMESVFPVLYQSFPALLLTSCALVQAVHRFCSGNLNPPLRQIRRAENIEEALETVASGMEATDGEQDGLRQRRTKQQQNDYQLEDDSVMPQEPPSLHSSMSASASSASAKPPPMQRASSIPMSSASSSSSSQAQLHPPPRRWHSIGDILLLMEQSGLMTFTYPIEETLRLHGPQTKSRKKLRHASGVTQTNADVPHLSSSSSIAVQSPSSLSVPSEATSVMVAAAPDSDPHRNSDSDSDEDDASDESSDSDFEPPHDLFDGGSGMENDEEEDEEDDEEFEDDEDEENAEDQPGENGQAPAASSSRVRNIIFEADVDTFGNLFISAQDVTELVQKEEAASKAADAPPTLEKSKSVISEHTVASTTGVNGEALSATSNGFQGASTPLIASLSPPSSPGLMPKATVVSKTPRKPAASAKLAFKDALQFLKLQNTMDENRRQEHKLIRRQLHTMRLHETLRQLFKLAIIVSMLWSLREHGIIHLLLRYGNFFLFVFTLLQLIGFEFPWQHLFDAPNQPHPLLAPNFNNFNLQDFPPPQGLPPAGLNLDGEQPALPIALAIDFAAFFGLAQPPIVLHPNAENQPLDMQALNPPPQPEVAADLLQKRRMRRLILAALLIVSFETYNYLYDGHDPTWFTDLVLSFIRFTPLMAAGIVLIVLSSSDIGFRNPRVLAAFATCLAVELLFWFFDFRSSNMNALLALVWNTIGPKLARIAIACARVAPFLGVVAGAVNLVVNVVSAVGPVMLTAAIPNDGWNAHPNNQHLVINLNPLAQDWPLIGNIIRLNPRIRHAAKLLLLAVLAGGVVETLYAYLDFQLPFLTNTANRLRQVAPAVLALVYEMFVFESRGVLLGLAFMRVIWVVDQSLPIQRLTILKNVADRHRERPATLSTKTDDTATSDAEVTSSSTAPSSSSASSTESSPSDVDSISDAPQLKCLSCERRRNPFFLVKCIQDFIFESQLFFTYPASGVQGMLIQRKEQELNPHHHSEHHHSKRKKKATRKKSHPSDDESKESHTGEDSEVSSETVPQQHPQALVQLQTCVDCTLHSIHMQLILPFIYFFVVYRLFMVVFPPPMHSSYNELILSTMHYLFDRVPLLVIVDLVLGWWHERVLQHKKAYVIVSSIVLLYASYITFYSYWYSVGQWYLFPGFLYQPTMNATSYLVLDGMWLALWVLN